MSPNPLDQLRDFHSPEPIGLWPIAPGWWLLAILTVGVVIAIVKYARRYFRENAWKKPAISELDSLIDAYSTDQGDVSLSKLSAFVKRFTARLTNDPTLKAMPSEFWVSLVALGPGKLSKEEGEILFLSQYKPEVEKLEQESLVKLKQFIRKLRPENIDPRGAQ